VREQGGGGVGCLGGAYQSDALTVAKGDTSGAPALVYIGVSHPAHGMTRWCIQAPFIDSTLIAVSGPFVYRRVAPSTQIT
jgi:hypothetical protein